MNPALILALRSWWKAGVGAALMFAPAFMLGQCSGARNERTEIRAEQQKAAAAAERIARAADALLRARQAQAAETITADRKALDNATSGIPDQALSARQRARYCHELRRQGADLSGTPCGPVR